MITLASLGALDPRIVKRITISESGCWEYQGALTAGYPELTRDGNPWRGNRWVWTLFFGPIPRGKFVCHSCDNRKCVNPAHLFLGTPQDNVDDMHAKGRRLYTKRLSESEMAAVIAQCMAGMPQRSVAAKFGISQTLVSMALSGKRWRTNADHR